MSAASQLPTATDGRAASGHRCPNCPDGDPWQCHCNPDTYVHTGGLVTRPGCPFCEIAAGNAPATVLGEWKGGAWGTQIIAIVPLTPIVDGHILVLPKTHVVDFTKSAQVAGDVMTRASILAHGMRQPVNLITGAGREATQSVWHLHVHLVPRAENDGLALPWYSGRTKARGRRKECP